MNSFVIGGSMEIRWMTVTLQQEFGMYVLYPAESLCHAR